MKTFLPKDMLQIGKNTVPWIYVVSDLSGEEITGSFYEKELIIVLIVGLIKKILYKNDRILS